MSRPTSCDTCGTPDRPAPCRLVPGSHHDTEVAAHSPVAAALVRVAQKMSDSSRRCHDGAARRRAAGLSGRLIAEQANLAEAFCHAEMAIRGELRELTGMWPVDDRPEPEPPAELAAPARVAHAGDQPLPLFALEGVRA